MPELFGATSIADDSVTFAKMQNIGTDTLIGRDTAGTGDPESISLATSLEFTGSGSIQRSALTGDVTASAGSNATTIANDAVTTVKILDDNVTYAKIQNVSATDRLLGRDTAGSGNVEEISLGTGLAWSGSQSITIDSTVVTETSTDTLTNKTLTTPTINGVNFNEEAKTTNYTITATDNVIRADASAGAFTLTLPTAASIAGRTYVIIRTDIDSSTNLLSIDGNGAETIDGITTWKLSPGEKISVMSDGTNWVTVYHDNPARAGYYFLKNSTNNRRYIAGSTNSANGVATSTSSPAVDTLWALPFVVGKVTKFDTISFHITTAQAAQNARAGIYFDNGNMYPGALIFDTGDISTASTGVKDTTITAGLQTFQPGLYWLTWVTSATTIQIRTLNTNTGIWGFAQATNVLGTGTMEYGYSVAHTYGALPDPFTGGATLLSSSAGASNPVPVLGLRVI